MSQKKPAKVRQQFYGIYT